MVLNLFIVVLKPRTSTSENKNTNHYNSRPPKLKHVIIKYSIKYPKLTVFHEIYFHSKWMNIILENLKIFSFECKINRAAKPSEV